MQNSKKFLINYYFINLTKYFPTQIFIFLVTVKL